MDLENNIISCPLELKPTSTSENDPITSSGKKKRKKPGPKKKIPPEKESSPTAVNYCQVVERHLLQVLFALHPHIILLSLHFPFLPSSLSHSWKPPLSVEDMHYLSQKVYQAANKLCNGRVICILEVPPLLDGEMENEFSQFIFQQANTILTPYG